MTIWASVVTLDGVDVSSQIVGQVKPNGEESMSRLCTFVIRPNAGTVSAGDWLGVPVTINYKTLDSSGNTLTNNRRFTGIVNNAVYSPTTRLVTFECTDNMQGKFEAMTQSEINALIVNSRDSDAVHGTYKDGWLHFEKVLATYPQAYDYNVDGVTGTLVDWVAKATPDFSFDSTSIVAGTIDYSIAPRRNLANKYIIDYSYRFGRLLHRAHSFVWTGFVFNDYLYQSHELPTREMITSAAQSAGWVLSSKIQFEKLPPSGTYNGVNFINSDYNDDPLATRANWHAIKRWSQDVTENYAVTVQFPQSIAWLGEVAYEEFASRQTDLNADEWKDGVDTPTGRTNSQNDIVQDKYDRALSRNDLETLVARAWTEGLAFHRENYVSAKIELNPLIERFHTVYLNDNGIEGQGKVFSIDELMDHETGEASMVITIAISLNGGGAAISDSAITYPVEPATDPTTAAPSDSTSLATHIGNDDTVANYDPAWDGFTGNYSLAVGTPTPEQYYPRQFRVVTPEINQDAIDHIEAASSQTYSFNIPNETLNITVPA